MGTVLKGATLAELEPASVETGDLRIAGGRIVARGVVRPEPGDELIDLTGKLVLPGLVSAHHHLTSTLLRGAKRKPGFESEVLLRGQLEEALTLDDVEAAATAGSLEGLLAGTTTVFDVHASPKVKGGLSRVASGLARVGLRGVIAHQIGERDGRPAHEEALEELAGFSAKAKGRLRAAVAMGTLDTLSDEALACVREVRDAKKLPILATLAEDRLEEKRCVDRFGAPPIDRLMDANLVTERSVFAQGVHLSWPDLSRLLGTGTWMAHAARSNMASQAGLATAAKFGVRACLGTDVMSLDLLAEAQAAWLRASDSGLPIDVLHFLANGHRLATEIFGAPFGPLREGAVADLIVFDYHAPTPLDAGTLGAHLLHGLSSREVESVMIDGSWRLWKRHALALDASEVARACRESARAVWSRLSC